jgi:diaminopimelate epimerase
VTGFWKAYAEGNSYVIVDAPADPTALLPWVVDSGLGVGGDGVLLADWQRGGPIGMRVFNADGTEAPACANGARCLAALAIVAGRASGESVVVRSAGAELTHWLVDREQLRLTQSMAVPAEPVVWRGEDCCQVELGTAHRVVFGALDGLDGLDADREGRRRCGEWPGGTNVMFTSAVGHARLRVIPWERGVGPTRGCASGAAAAVLAMADSEPSWPESVAVEQPGGTVQVRRRAGSVEITGTVRLVARGTLVSR